jgi:folate-binding protein YgfZ
VISPQANNPMTTSQPPATADDNLSTFPECALIDLSHYGLIRLSGEDMRTYLQGQVTNDVNRVTAEIAQPNSYCSPKGRMLGSFWLFERDGDLYMQLPAERLTPALKRLSMFVLRSKVTLSDATGTVVRAGLAGDCAPTLLDVVPAETWGTVPDGDITVLRLPGDRPRFELLGPEAAMRPLLARLAGKTEPASAAFWRLMDIRTGLASVYDATEEAFVPQMANLQLIGGVSFTKGCYTGQEVVARMQYLGKLKRRMYRAKIEADACPTPGAELYSSDHDSGQAVGRVVDAAPSPNGGFECLVVLQINIAETGNVSLSSPDGPRIELLSLPYAFDPVED